MGRELPASALGDEALTWDEEVDGYCLGKDHEVEACCRMASECELLEPEDIAEMKTYWLEGGVEVQGFQGPPRR